MQPREGPNGDRTDGAPAPRWSRGGSRFGAAGPANSTAAGRSSTVARRLDSATGRDEGASVRDHTGATRDRLADARDKRAELRDAVAESRERRAVGADVDDLRDALRAHRAAAAASRRSSARDRTAAAADREAAAIDRRHAEEDRRHADADRRHAGVDELTGFFRREAGELALTHEIERSRRSGDSLILAMIDVDALKAINDRHGHAAGDALLRDVAAAIASTMRSYNVTVRWGGDEFICSLFGVTLDVASGRIAEIQRALEDRRPGASISAGLAEFADDTLESLIARADAALYDTKAHRAI